MDKNRRKQDDADGPKQLGIALEEVSVAVDGLGAEEDLEVAGEVADDEQDQQEAGAGHEIFLAQRRTKKVAKKIRHLNALASIAITFRESNERKAVASMILSKY